MTRREWQAAIASVVLWSGAAFAQSPALVPGETASVVTIRTAGQPDRKLQVLKTERLPDGKYLTEVKDLASGAIFTIADTKPLGTPEATKLPVSTPAAAAATPTLLPGTTVPSTGGLPQARPRNADPLLGGSPAAAAGTTRPAAQPEIPTLVGRLKKTSTPATTTATPSTQSGVSKALFGDYNSVPATQPTLAGRFSEPTNAKPTTTTVATAPVASPTLMGKLFGDSSSAPPQPLVASKPAPTMTVAKAPTATVFRPNAVPEPVRTAAIAPPLMPTMPVAQPIQPVAVATPKIVPAQPVEQVSLNPVSTDPRDPNFHVVPVKPMTMKQIEDLVKDLRMHHKPSQRVEAAKALAASPMAAMVEVRQILAEASYRDPEPVVRANCIDLLTKMQYDEPNYRKYVEGLVNDDEPAVQRAAKASMR